MAPSGLVDAALASGARMVVLEGHWSPGRRLRSAGLSPLRFLPLPSVEEPELLLPLEQPEPLRYALEGWAPPARRWKRIRNLLLQVLARRGVLPPVRPLVTVALRDPEPPFLIALARQLGVPADARWLLAPGQGDVLTRGAFHVFLPGSVAPSWVLKFARVPGLREPFDRDERGLRIAQSAGGAAAAHAPRLVGRLELDGLHASLETAAVGQRLVTYLHSSASRAAKERVVERVASWLVDVARETASPPGALEAERVRLAREVVPRWRSLGSSTDLVERLPSLPAVLQHNDVGSWNVVLGEGRFTVIDWESTRETGFPLWDLWYLLADALPHLDGATGLGAQEEYFVRLFSGELASSELLFGWTRRMAAALSIPPEAVGPLSTLCWLDHGLSHAERQESLDSHAVGEQAPVFLAQRIPALWYSHPALGPGWNRWRA